MMFLMSAAHIFKVNHKRPGTATLVCYSEVKNQVQEQPGLHRLLMRGRKEERREGRRGEEREENKEQLILGFMLFISNIVMYS